MFKTLHKTRVLAFIILLIELLAVLITGVFWYLNLYDCQTYLKAEYLLMGAAAFLVIDGLFTWLSLSKITKMRQKSDIDAVELIGPDIQEAYDFGQVGLVVVDEDNVIVWTSPLFKDRQMDLIDTNAFDWLPELRDLVNAPVNKVVTVEVKGSDYQVKYLSEPRMYIFKDVTDYDHVVRLSQQEAVVIGIVMIDNYNDVVNETDETGDFVQKVRTIIADYFKSFNVLLRRVKSDTYFAVCNFKSLSLMQEDKFSVLQKVREAGKGEENPLTLSIGFAHYFPDVMKLNEMASSAVDVALSRGGDQAVVSQYGTELKFFGGNSAAYEDTSKVKFRSFSGSLTNLIKSSSNVFVMGHADMDMDALGASLGVVAICRHFGKDAKIIYSPKMAEKKARIAFQQSFSKDELDQMTISVEDAPGAMSAGTLLIVVDISRPSLTICPRALDKSSKTIVIDHHRRSEEFIERPVLAYIDPSASSASELIAMMIRYSTENPKIELSPAFATLMLSGMFLDTNSFKNKSTGIRTFEAAEILKEYGADNSKADDFLKDEFEEYTLITKIISTMVTPHYGVVYCTSDDNDIIERSTLSKVGNQIMQLKGINAAFVIGRTAEKTVRLSARSDGTVNVQLLCEKMGGGGHYQAAACAFNNSTTDKVVATLNETLDEYLDTARSGPVGG